MDKWLVLISACGRTGFLTGSLKANGVILEYLVQMLNTSHTSVAGAFAIQNALSFMTAPLVHLLLMVLSGRQSYIIGAFLVSVAYICCGLFATSVMQLFLFYSISGLGFGLMTLPSYLAVQQHFQDSFPLAICFVKMCYFVGTAILPPLLDYLVREYGLAQGMALFGVVLLNLVPCGVAQKEKRTEIRHEGKSNNDNGHEADNKEPERPWYLKTANAAQHTLGSLKMHWKSFGKFLIMQSVEYYILASCTIFMVSLGEAAGLNSNIAVLLSTYWGVGALLGTATVFVLLYLGTVNIYYCCLLASLIHAFSLLGQGITFNQNWLFFLSTVTGFSQGMIGTIWSGLVPSKVCGLHFRHAAVLTYFEAGMAIQLGGLISGLIRDMTGSPQYIFIFDALLCFLSVPVIFLSSLDVPPTEDCDIDEG